MSFSPHLSPAPDGDLRHVVTSSTLSPRRTPNKLGSLSPSAPSSPTSVHSSSSAIFERDIEPIAPSPPNSSHPSNPHRIPRGKATEQLEFSVPSVLDSAATALASPDDATVAVVAPAHPSPELIATSRSGLTSPASRFSSRSPSPTAARSLSVPSPSPSFSIPLPPLSGGIRPAMQTQPSNSSSIPAMPGAYLPTPTATSPPSELSQALIPEPPTPTTAGAPPSSVPTSSTFPHPPPSPRSASNRLSFISYTDLLTSAPSSSVPLSSLTTAATVTDPPPHLPSVLGLPQQQQASGGSLNTSTRSSWYCHDRDIREGREGLFVDEAGGEWEREGLGQGLEERLESLMGMSQVGQVTSRA